MGENEIGFRLVRAKTDARIFLGEVDKNRKQKRIIPSTACSKQPSRATGRFSDRRGRAALRASNRRGIFYDSPGRARGSVEIYWLAVGIMTAETDIVRETLS